MEPCCHQDKQYYNSIVEVYFTLAYVSLRKGNASNPSLLMKALSLPLACDRHEVLCVTVRNAKSFSGLTLREI